jgi:uncharacterized membrane protein
MFETWLHYFIIGFGFLSGLMVAGVLIPLGMIITVTMLTLILETMDEFWNWLVKMKIKFDCLFI